MNQKNDVITLDMNGVEVDFDVLGYFEVEKNDGKEYIALFPVGGGEESFVQLFGYVSSGEDEYELVNIASEEEYMNAVEAFEALIGEQ